MTRFDPDGRPDDDARSGIAENEHGTTITPIEAMIDRDSTRKLHAQAELSAQILEERTKQAKAPVHMAGLKPLPDELRKAAPAAGVIPGGPDALGMTPRMARTIPAPYQRPRIAVDHHGKTWGYAAADTVEPGDIVVDFGKVERSTPYVQHELIAGVRAATVEGIILTNIAGSQLDVKSDEQLRVFRVHDQD